jgi:hypothetical protein
MVFGTVGLSASVPYNPANKAFTDDPVAFLASNLVSHLEFDLYVFGKDYVAERSHRHRAGAVLMEFQDAGTIDLDLVKMSGWFSSYYLLRPIIRTQVGAATTLTQPQRDALAEQLPPDPPNVIRGYYFPYKTGTVSSTADMGWVDIPKNAPAHTFAFTGAMQGCSIVVTDSPASGAHFRVFHYQNTSSNPIYLPAPKGTQVFPGVLRAWLHFNDYGINGDAHHVHGFNFLHHNGIHWRIVSQPLSATADKNTGILTPSKSNKAAVTPMVIDPNVVLTYAGVNF